MKYLSFLLLFIFLSFNSIAQNDDWSSYGKDPGGGHFSKATEITPGNVKDLETQLDKNPDKALDVTVIDEVIEEEILNPSSEDSKGNQSQMTLDN